MNQTRIARINADDYLIKFVKISPIRVLLTVAHAHMENIGDMGTSR
jgi:hypothetical protein